LLHATQNHSNSSNTLCRLQGVLLLMLHLLLHTDV
jgi:hypothetical protein